MTEASSSVCIIIETYGRSNALEQAGGPAAASRVGTRKDSTGRLHLVSHGGHPCLRVRCADGLTAITAGGGGAGDRSAGGGGSLGATCTECSGRGARCGGRPVGRRSAALHGRLVIAGKVQYHPQSRSRRAYGRRAMRRSQCGDQRGV